MEITLVGLILIIFAPFFIRRPLIISAFLAGSVTFSATAVINFPSASFGLQPYHFFGVLLIFSTIVFRGRKLFNSIIFAPFTSLWLFLFLGWCIISVMVNGLQNTSIAHALHLLFGSLIMYCIVANNQKFSDFKIILSGLVSGVVVSATWAWIQLIIYISGNVYPDWLFNNSVGQSAQGFGASVLTGLFPRVSSVSTEPSYFVRSLIPVLWIVLCKSYFERMNFCLKYSNKHRYYYIFIIFSALIISTSTLGIFGFGALIVMSFLFFKDNRFIYFCAFLLIMIAILSLGKIYPIISDAFDEIMFGKFELGSGEERAQSVYDALYIFLENPIFGGGPGLVTSHDMVVKLLSNFGLFGFIYFILFLIASLDFRVFFKYQFIPLSVNFFTISIFGANVLLWTMDLVAGVSYQYGIFWVLLALSISLKNLIIFRKN